MRPLTDDESQTLFEKLAKFIGKDIRKLVDRPEDPHVFRLHKDRVYYVSERLMRLSTNVGKDALLSLGTCLGKFTKSRKFHLKITALPILAQYAKYKVWLKPAAEMTYLYGNHVPKVGIARMTEAIPQYAGVLVLNLTDIPLGFGVAAHSTETATAVDATAAVVLHQADVVVPELRDVRTVLFAVNSAESADTTRAGMHWSAGVLQRGVQPGVVHAVHADSTAEALNENHFMACVLPGMVALVRAAGWLDSAPGQPACVVHTSCLQAPLQPSGNDCGPCACATLCAWAAAAVRGSGTDLREVELTPPDVRGMRMSLYQLAQSMREHTTAIASAALLPGLVDDDMPLE